MLARRLAAEVSTERRWKFSSATPASSVPVPARKRGSILLISFELIIAPKTIANGNGRKARPACSGL